MRDTINDESQLDVLRGAKRIGAFIGLNVRQAFYALEKGELPAKKICGRWVSTKQQLRRLVEAS